MSWNVARRPPASGNMITAGHGPAPSGVCRLASHVPSGVGIETSRWVIGASSLGSPDVDSAVRPDVPSAVRRSAGQARAPAASGSVTVTVVPAPSTLSTSIAPPWAATAASAIDMPSPLPPRWRARAGSAR